MMKLPMIAVLAAALLAGPALHAQQAAAPAGSTGQCKDGSYTDHAAKRGACSGHKGVKEWYGAAAPAAAAPAAPAAPAAAPAQAATPAAPAAAAAGKKGSWSTPAANAAPGGGAGQVWVNSSSKVYHCQGDKWYGKTKQGQYMSEADAKAKGYHGVRGKTCG